MIKKGDLSGSEYDVEGDSNSNNHWLQRQYAEEHL